MNASSCHICVHRHLREHATKDIACSFSGPVVVSFTVTKVYKVVQNADWLPKDNRASS